MSKSNDTGSNSNNERSGRPTHRSRVEYGANNNLKDLYSYLSPEEKDAFLFANSQNAKNLLEKAKRARTKKRVRAQGPVSQTRFIGPHIPSHITKEKHRAYREEVRAARIKREKHLAALAALDEQLLRLSSYSKTPVKTRTKSPRIKSRAEVLDDIAQERSKKEASTRKAAHLASISRARTRVAEARKNPKTSRHFKRGYQLFEPDPVARGETPGNLAERYARRLGLKRIGNR